MATPFDNIIRDYLTASGTVDHVKLDMAQILEKPFANPVDILTVKVLKLALAQMKKEAMDALDGGEDEIDDGVTTLSPQKCQTCNRTTETNRTVGCTAKDCRGRVECCSDCDDHGFLICDLCAQTGVNSVRMHAKKLWPAPESLCPCCDCFFPKLVKARCGADGGKSPTGCPNPIECCKDCDESGDAKCQECLSGDVRDSASDSSDEDGYEGDSGDEDAEVGAEEKLEADPNRLAKCGGCRMFVRVFAMEDGVCQADECTNETLRCYACYTDGDVMCYNCQWGAEHL